MTSWIDVLREREAAVRRRRWPWAARRTAALALPAGALLGVLIALWVGTSFHATSGVAGACIVWITGTVIGVRWNQRDAERIAAEIVEWQRQHPERPNA